MASAMRSFMLPVGLTLSNLIRMRAQPCGASRDSASIGVLPIDWRMEVPARGGITSIMLTTPLPMYLHLMYIHEYGTRQARREGARYRGTRGGRHLRRAEQPGSRAAYHALPGGADGRDRSQSRAVRPDGTYRRGRGRHDQRPGRAHRPRPDHAVAQPACAGAH